MRTCGSATQGRLALLCGPEGPSERLEAVLADGRRAHSHLDAANEVPVAVDQAPEQVDVEIGQVRAPVVPSHETDVRDVQERRDADARAVDDELTQSGERQRPAEPASFQVVVPEDDPIGSGSMPQYVTLWKTCVCRSTRPGVTYCPSASIGRSASAVVDRNPDPVERLEPDESVMVEVHARGAELAC
jgi:hypothetical protein